MSNDNDKPRPVKVNIKKLADAKTVSSTTESIPSLSSKDTRSEKQD